MAGYPISAGTPKPIRQVRGMLQRPHFNGIAESDPGSPLRSDGKTPYNYDSGVSRVCEAVAPAVIDGQLRTARTLTARQSAIQEELNIPS
jgi:hypothetical protein